MKRLITFNLSLILLLANFFNSTTSQAKTEVLPAFFTPSVYSGCAPLTVDFYNASIGLGSYSWLFGDPSSGIYNTSIACAPSHTFNNPGVYTVTLSFTNVNGTFTHTQNITVYPRPNPIITGKDTTCEGKTYTYSVTPVLGHSYLWQTVGGVIVSGGNTNSVTVQWPVSGAQTITVTQTSNFGCSKSVTKPVFTVPLPQFPFTCSKRKEGTGQPGPDKDLPSSGCVCAYDRDTFTIPNPYGYTFNWSVTGSATITYISGGTADTMIVLWGAGPTATIQVIGTSPYGCTDTAKCVFNICPGPNASAWADTACVSNFFQNPTNFNAGNTTPAGLTNFQWAFGDNTFANTSSPLISHTYAAAGTYFARLRVFNSNGCFDDTIIKVIVQPGTSPPIECPGTVCHNTTRCYKTPYFPGAVYTWKITGHISASPSPNGDSICITWGAGPIGTIELTVTGGPYTCGKSEVQIPIFPAQVPLSYPAYLCMGEPNLISAPLIPGTCYTWTHSNGVLKWVTNAGNVIGVNPNMPGFDTIRLSMKNGLICCSLDTQIIVPVRPALQIFGPGTVCPGDTVLYNSNGAVTWSVTGGVIYPPSITPTSVQIIWGTGPYGYITVTAVNPNLWCTPTKTTQITIQNPPPAPPLMGPVKVCKGSNNLYSYIPDPQIVSSTWTVSPMTGVVNTTINAQQHNIKFNTVGNYTITVTYVGSNGCKSRTNMQVLVIDTALPAITGPATTCIGAIALYTIPSNPGGIYNWNVIGGNIISGLGNDSLVVQWGNMNTGQVIVSNSLCGGIKRKNVTINNIPNVFITVKDTTCSGTTIRLCASPGFASYLWTPTAQVTSCIIVSSPNTYIVKVGNGTGCFGYDTLVLNTIPKLPKPVVSITGTPMQSPFCPPFINIQATINNTWTYIWNPSGQTQSSVQDSQRNKTYTVIVTNPHGCKDTESYTIPNIPCIPGPGGGSTPCNHIGTLSISYDQCTGQFTSTSSNITTMFWNFGDGYFANGFNPNHIFPALGTYIVSVTALDNGIKPCWKTYQFAITVNSILFGKPKHWRPTLCNYTLYNFSVIPKPTFVSASTISYNWNFGDPASGGLNTSTSATPNHNFTADGTYYVTLTVNDNWCTRVLLDTVVVKALRASYFNCPGCTGQPAQFVDQSTYSAPITMWSWNFGDATTSNLQSPFHIYSAPGPYTVTLTVTDNNGCTSTYVSTIVVTTFNAGALSFTINGTPVFGNNFTICPNDRFVAFSPFNVNYTYNWNDGKTTKNDTIKQSGSYWVIITDGSCHDTLGPFTLTVNPKPKALISGPFSNCGPVYLMCQPGSGYTYQWYNAGVPIPFETNLTYYATASGTYQCVVTNSFGCRDTATHTINIKTLPVVNITPNYTSFCDGGSLVLTASSTPTSPSYVWSTGVSGTSITVYQSGVYTAQFVAPNGCPGIGSSYITVNPLPDLSIVPKGCYKICSGHTAQVCGPQPINLSQVFTYKWFRNNTFVTNTQNINITLPGSYFLIVQNTVTGCIDTSEVFDVDTVTGPVTTIIIQGPPVICTSSTSPIILSTDNTDPEVMIEWLENNVIFSTSNQVIINHPGTYVLHEHRSDCCESFDTIVISEEDCCWDSTVSFKYIPDGYTVNSNEVWDGKYYIAGKVFVNNNSIFDLTEVDCVFDTDGEIIFNNTSFVRANNSVFRPCTKDSIWVGFTFKDSSAGYVYTSLYKNATIALNIINKGDYSLRIADNTFANCWIGVNVVKNQNNYPDGITNNSFVIANDKLSYLNNNYFGIKLQNVIFKDLISQNQFRTADFYKQINRYYGIYSVRSSATLSENKFSNMFRSIDVVSAGKFYNIENNEIELTQTPNVQEDYQIRITDNTGNVFVFANELRSSISDYYPSVAIYAKNSSYIKIKDNNIKGFMYGIQTFDCKNITITENDIDMGNHTGIYCENGLSHDVSCNIVRMKNYNNSPVSTLPYGIRLRNMSSTNRVFTNCVFDCGTAMLFDHSTPGTQLPVIRNNYIYNLNRFGIRVLSQVGNIGTGAGFGNAGRNTIISNNKGTAFAWEIFSTPGVVEAGNYYGGPPFATNIPNTGSQNRFASSAACGQQILNPADNKIDKYNICDVYKENIHPIDGNTFANTQIVSFVFMIKKLDDGDYTSEKLATMAKIIGSNHKGEVNNFEAWVNASKTLKNEEKAFIMYNLWQNAGELTKALNAANSIDGSSSDASDLKAILIADLNDGQSQKASENTIQQMKAIDAKNGKYSDLARDYVQKWDGSSDHLFNRIAELPLDPEQTDKHLWENTLQAYPVPVSDQLNLLYNIKGDGPVNIEIFNSTGVKVFQKSVATLSGKEQIDVKQLSSGVYIVKVTESAEKNSIRVKFVKQ